MIEQQLQGHCPGSSGIACFDPSADLVRENPYPFYDWLRSHDPVHWGASGDPTVSGCWYITRYQDAVAVLKDGRFGHEPPIEGWNGRGTGPRRIESVACRRAINQATKHWMFMRDPPAHTRLRGYAARYFTPAAIRRHGGRIQAIIDELLDRLADNNRMDAVGQLGEPLSVISVAEIIGVPSQDRDRFIPWTRALSAMIEFDKTDAVMQRGLEAIHELNDYLLDLIQKRRTEPGHDLISALVARSEAENIGDDELLGTCTQLLFGGNEPVAHLISLGLVSLLRNPGELARWRAEPGIDKTAVEELMRYDSSVQMTFRRGLVDCEIQGRKIRQGDLVAVVFGSANRDPQMFADPDRLNLCRRPNRHLSLGKGRHVCLGAALARLVGRFAFSSMLNRLPEMSLASSRLDWAASVAVRGLRRLDVDFS